LNAREHRTLEFIRQDHRVETVDGLAQRYVKLMKERDFEAFDLWLEGCLRCGLPDLESFAQGVQMDYEAIKTSLLLSYSNGPVEGHVNKLKFVKRSMYGRGSFDLLRQRVLKAS
jgi:transposase